MKRVAELDALRGIAAVLIVAYHYSDPGPIHDHYLYFGVISLELFFVLSGFLISSIILSHDGEPGFLRAFYARRGLRIWPAYYVTIFAYCALVAARPEFGDIRGAPYYLTFTQNLSFYWFGVPFLLAKQVSPTWSLAVEEQFYIVWPLLTRAFGVRRMIPIAVVCIAVSIVSRFAGYDDRILIARCDGFAIGGLLAVALAGRNGDRAATRGFGFALFAAGAISFVYLTAGLTLMGGRPFDMVDAPGAAINTTIVGIFFACLIGLVVRNRGHAALAPLRARWLCYLGTISYGLYLYHMTALFIADVAGGRLHLPPILIRVAIAPVLCLAIAATSWAVLEKPCLRLKDRFRYGIPLVQTPIEPDVEAVQT